MTWRPRGGRHRFGSPELRYCRDIPAVSHRLQGSDRTRHASGAGTWRVHPAYAIGAGLVAVLLGAVLTAGQAVAQQLAHR